MDKLQVNKYIESICVQMPVVNSFYTDDVYECWNTDEVKYGSVSFVITSSSISENTTTWSGLIYYADRLTEDKSNRDNIQSDAIRVINAVMNAIYSDDDIVSINYPTQVELFEQQFVDWVAGGYATVQIETPNTINKCGYGYIKEPTGWEKVVADLNAEIDVLEGENDRLNSENSTLKTENDSLESENITLKTENGQLSDANNQLETENDRLESEVGRLESEVDDLNRQLNESILPNYTSIGYDLETADSFYQYEYDAIERAKRGNFIEPGSTSFSGRESTVVYFPTDWDEPKISSLNFRSNKHVRVIPDCPTLRKNNYQSLTNDIFYDCCNLVYAGRIKSLNTSINLETTLYGCYNLIKTPVFDFPIGTTITNIRSLLNYCESVKDISTLSDLDVSGVTDISRTFFGCRSLTDLTPIANWDISNVTNMSNTFNNCRSLTDLTPIANWDTSSVTAIGYLTSYPSEGLFSNCYSLTDLTPIANWDTSNVTNMICTFRNCYALTTLDGLQNWDTSSVTDLRHTFYGCMSLTDLTPIANWDISNVTNMSNTFDSCMSLADLTPIANWDTSNVTNMNNTFYSCTRLKSIPLLDFSSVTTINAFFGYSTFSDLTDLGGFTGLKVNFDGLSRCPNLTVQSLLNVFNTIADVNGLGTRTLTIGSTNLNKLTDEQKAIATTKGWYLM